MVVRAKICGTTSLEDALLCVDAGADALGFVFYPRSPRYVTPETVRTIVRQLPPFVVTVGVFVDEPSECVNAVAAFCNLDRVQLHGNETPQDCERIERAVVKAFRVRPDATLSFADYRVHAFLLDAYVANSPGGTGHRFDWARAIEAKRHGRVILAGGLTPDNVGEAIRTVEPYAVDVVTGVEASPGRKDAEKVRSFLRNVRSFDSV
jgi:phosphoribosylanthranilate isomerase